jgi:GAF domain-containing protein
MEPVAETREALNRLHREGDDGTLADLDRLTGQVRRIVPECVGLSVGTSDSGVTLTFVDTSTPLGSVDPVDYLARVLDEVPEPATETGEPSVADPTDEDRWRLHSRAEAPAGIESSLSIPLVDDDRVVGTVTFYGSGPDTFAGREEALAELCGAWAPGAVRNDDLSFSSRLRAAAAPAILEEQSSIDRATVIAAEELDLPVEHTRRRMRAASRRAGITELDLARLVLASREA